MKHSVPHDLDAPTARRVADAAWASYSDRFERFSPTIDWVTEAQAKIGFTAKGITLKGELSLTPSTIDMDLSVPFLLRLFKKKAISVIEQEIRKWIAKAEAGEI